MDKGHVLGDNYKKLKESNFEGEENTDHSNIISTEIEALTIIKDELEQCKMLSKTNIDILIHNLKYRLNRRLIYREESD